MKSHNAARYKKRLSLLSRILAGVLAVAVTCAGSADTTTETLVLAIQPVLNEKQTLRAFSPLAEYIEKATGRKCIVRTWPNFFAYWDSTRRGTDYDLVLDAAHFTDYRVKKLGFQVLAKIPDSVSYSLIVRDDNLIIDPAELIGRPIATLGVPSVGAVKLNALFPNPVRQPITVEVNSSEEGMNLLLENKVSGAIIPTPIVSLYMREGAGIMLVTTTEPIPHIALSAGPAIDTATRNRIRQAVVTANQSIEGKNMLKNIGFQRFESASSRLYEGYSDALRPYWGY